MNIREKIANLSTSVSRVTLRIYNKILDWRSPSGGESGEGTEPYGQKLFLKSITIAATGTLGLYMTTSPANIFGQVLSFTWLWIWGSAAYIVFSFRFSDPVGPDQLAVRTFFGRPTDVVHSGLPFVPLGLYELHKLPGTVTQREFPTEPEKVYHEEGEVPEGMKPPIRITFSESLPSAREARRAFGEKDYEVIDLHRIYNVNWSDYTYQELDAMERSSTNTIKFNHEAPTDGLARRVTAEAVLYVTWRIEDATKFIQNVSPLETVDTKDFDVTEKLIAEVNKRIEDEMISVVTRLLQKMSYGQAQNNIAWINAHLFFAVIKRTLGWGIKIEGAVVKKIDAPKRVNVAIAEAAKAQFQGNADRELAIKKGEGAAQAARDLEEQTLAGRAAGYRRLKEEAGLTGEQVLAGEIAGRIADGGNTVVVGSGGFSELAGVAAAALKPKPTPKQIGGTTEE